VAVTKRRALTIALAALAVIATFGIGILVGRELTRPPSVRPQDPSVRYDLGAFAAVAPELLAYRVLLRVPIDLAKPRGIASAPDGTIWACGDRAVIAVDRKGAVTARYALGGEPTCVALGGDGRIFVGMGDHVEVVDPRGAVVSWPDLGSQAIVTSITVNGADVFVADAGNRMVMRFDARGKLAGTIGTGYAVPSPYFDVASAPDGTLWVADPGNQRVRHADLTGKTLAAWGRSSLDIDGFGGCCNPAHLALLPCGSIVTSEKGLLRIKVYEPDGRLAAVVATPADFPASETSLDLATRKANGGEILVLVPGERAVRIYVKKGAASGG
jgi:DNA-binding beta-propeller fold protein YncE